MSPNQRLRKQVYSWTTYCLKQGTKALINSSDIKGFPEPWGNHLACGIYLCLPAYKFPSGCLKLEVRLGAGIAFTCCLTSIWGLCPPAWRNRERRQGGFWRLPHPSDGSQETPTRLCGAGGLWQAYSGCHAQLQLLCHHWGHGWSFQIYQTHQKVRHSFTKVSRWHASYPQPSAFLMPSFS